MKKNFTIFLILFYSLLFASNSEAQNLKIGIAIPLFEDSEEPSRKQLGEEILSGINFAFNEYNRNPVVKITLDIRDTKKDDEIVFDIINQFGSDTGVICVLGPIYSSELETVKELGLAYGLPIVSPTATGDSLAENYNFLFQLNPSYKVRGTLMTDYLVKKLGLKNFVIISEKNYGKNFSQHFETAAKKLGADILLTEFYDRNLKNINIIVENINKLIREKDLFINPSNLNITQLKKLENSGLRYSLLDSLINYKLDVSIYYLFGKNAKKIIDTLNIKPYPLKPDVTKFIQGYIDAIYIPISTASDISLIVPELYSNGLTFFIAGTGDWNNPEVLKENSIYLKNLYFESEYFPDENSQKYKDLLTKLKNSKIKISKNFLFGYDSMNLILDIISKGNKTREQLYEALKKIVSYEFIRSRVSLDFNRINSELNILTYDGVIKRVEQYKLIK